MAEFREIVITGRSKNHGATLVARDYVPVEHLHTARALHLANGYDVDVPEPDTHNPGPGGEGQTIATAAWEAHAAYLAAIGVTDIQAHADGLKAKRSN
jgi:hypothetical protein